MRFLLDFLGYQFELQPAPAFVLEPLASEFLLRLATERLGGMLQAAKAALPFAKLLDVFAQICRPVAFMHARGIVHRDLKRESDVRSAPRACRVRPRCRMTAPRGRAAAR